MRAPKQNSLDSSHFRSLYRTYHSIVHVLTSVPSPLKKLSTWARSLSLRMPLLSGLRLCNSGSEPLKNSESFVCICGFVCCVQSMPCSNDSDAEPSDESLGGALSPMELKRARIFVCTDILEREKREYSTVRNVCVLCVGNWLDFMVYMWTAPGART